MAGVTLRYGLAPGGVYLVVHGSKPPPLDEWKLYVEDMEGHARAQALRVLFILSGGGGPDAVQRKWVAQMWKRLGGNPPIIAVAPRRVSLGVVIAMNWFLTNPIRTFSMDEIDEALKQLALTDMDRQAFCAQLAQAKQFFRTDFCPEDPG
jgi:hypothetical protein